MGAPLLRMGKERRYIGIRTYLPDKPTDQAATDVSDTKANLGVAGFDFRRKYKLFADSRFYVLGKRGRDYFRTIWEAIGILAGSIIALSNFPNMKAVALFYVIVGWVFMRVGLKAAPIILKWLRRYWA